MATGRAQVEAHSLLKCRARLSGNRLWLQEDKFQLDSGKCFHSDRGKILSVDTLSSGMLRPGQDAFQSWSCSDQGAGLGDLLRSLPTWMSVCFSICSFSVLLQTGTDSKPQQLHHCPTVTFWDAEYDNHLMPYAFSLRKPMGPAPWSLPNTGWWNVSCAWVAGFQSR